MEEQAWRRQIWSSWGRDKRVMSRSPWGIYKSGVEGTGLTGGINFRCLTAGLVFKVNRPE